MTSRNLLFVDVETTGLDPSQAEMIEIAWVLTDPTNERILETYEAKMRPERLDRNDPTCAKALEVNGYTDEEWAPSLCAPRAAVSEALLRAAKGVYLVGQNVSFDAGFCQALLRKEGKQGNWHYHLIDTAILAYPLLAFGAVSSLSLGALCTYFGITNEGAHRAMADVRRTRGVYARLMEMYRCGLSTPASAP